ncbi:hypothetical protein ACFZAG_38165 [Streptomyces sp. NPDC012403]|uniref:hypothetical protein n=1 Tax=Streptomyces sp. NPDC012403 TaxID=3364831 RepID=UPI0036E611E3
MNVQAGRQVVTGRHQVRQRPDVDARACATWMTVAADAPPGGWGTPCRLQVGVPTSPGPWPPCP